MAVVGLIMAGGKGTRMNALVEKPMINLGGKTMLERVVEVLKGSSQVAEVVVATSLHTPRTREMSENLGLRVIETSGEGYVTDAQQAIMRLVPRTVLVIGADLPLLSGELIDKVIDYYMKCGKPSLRVVVSNELHDKEGAEWLSHNGKDTLGRPIGINVIDSLHIGEPEIEESTYCIDSTDAVTNVNTVKDVARILRRKESYWKTIG